jgi:hypothetical protein
MGFLLLEEMQLCLVLIEGYMSSLYTQTSRLTPRVHKSHGQHHPADPLLTSSRN